MTEEPLTGGNVGGAVRLGDTVRRPVGPWTPAVHGLLTFLTDAGLDRVPTVLGMDDQGREILSYLPGRGVDPDSEIVVDGALIEATAWLRRFHVIVREYRPTGAINWRNGARELESDEIICHHDPGAYNWVVDGPRFAGMIDWDMAGPGHPVDDLAFMAWTAIPLFRPAPDAEVARRLILMADQYGDVDPATILSHADLA